MEKKNEELVNITIDGQKLQVPKGTNLIHAVAKVGKDVPHFCYHEGLSVAGQCRMCYVEVEGMRKLPTACSTIATEGMIVKTDSEIVKKSQEATLEFTLLNHPLDCPICDRGGECKLQDYTYEHGPARSRMHEEKRELKKHTDISEQIVLDQERCILCTRCVRFSAEVDGRTELVVQGRGHKNKLDVFDGRPMESNFSGNVVDLCPVGALTARDFRFNARPWELLKHEAICTGCSMACNIDIHTKHRHPSIPRPGQDSNNSEIERLTPRYNPQINEWWICDRGRWGYHFHNQSEERIESPMIQKEKSNDFQKSSFKEIQNEIEKHQSWEFWIDGSASNELISWAQNLSESWTKRGRQVSKINDHPFADAFLEQWNKRAPHLQKIDWSNIKTVVCQTEAREVEEEIPLLALKLGQKLRSGQLTWSKRSLENFYQESDSPEETLYLVPPPKNKNSLEQMSQIPSKAALLILWQQINSRGLLNHGLCPLEILESHVVGKQENKAVFFLSQRTQQKTHSHFAKYLQDAKFSVVADAFKSPYTKEAQVLLPIKGIYESNGSYFNIENIEQYSKGISIADPNEVGIARGGSSLAAEYSLL